MLSLKNSKDSKQFAVIKEKKTGKVLDTLHIIERNSYDLEEEPDLREKLSKYADIESEVTESGEDLIKNMRIKPEFTLFPVPPMFEVEGSNQRTAMSITGKSGSGKSYFIAKYVSAYHHMFPKELIYYVSAKPIEQSASYKELLAKASFKKVLIAVDLKTIKSALDVMKYKNCLFVFDDVMDVKVSLPIENISREYAEEKKQTYYEKEKIRIKRADERKREKFEEKGNVYTMLTGEQIKKKIIPMDPATLGLKLSDNSVIERLMKWKSNQITQYIRDSIQSLLKVGREQGVSVIATTHRFFEKDDTVQCTIDEAHSVVLFPYGNVSREKLVEFLRTKLCFSLPQARIVADRVYKQYEFLFINTSGSNFFMTSNYFEFL